MAMNDKINLTQKLTEFSDHWKPRILTQLNGQDVRIVKLLGTFDWHHHQHEDELFLVLEGRLDLRFRDRVVVLEAGEMIMVPRGVEHQPHAGEEVSVLLFEPSTTLNTGNVRSERTQEKLENL